MPPLDQHQPSEELLADIRTRVSRVCTHYGESELEELVWEIAFLRSKYDRMRDEGFVLAARKMMIDPHTRDWLRDIPPRAD